MFLESHSLTASCKPVRKSKEQKSVGRCCISASIPTLRSEILVCRIHFPWDDPVHNEWLDTSNYPWAARQSTCVLWTDSMDHWSQKSLTKGNRWLVGQYYRNRNLRNWFSSLNKTLWRKHSHQRSAGYPASQWSASRSWNKVCIAQTPGESGSCHWDWAYALGLCHTRVAT